MMKTTLSLLLAMLLLLGCLPTVSVSAALTPEQDEAVLATDLLEPLNPNATQEAKNLLAYLSSLTDTKQFVTGVFDMGMNDYVYNEVRDQFGVEVGLYSEKYLVVTKDDTPRDGLKALDFYDVDLVNDNLKRHYDNGNILLVQDEVRPLETFAPLAKEQGLIFDDDCTGIITHWDATNPERNMVLYEAHLHYSNSFVEALKGLEARGVKAYMLRPFVEFNYKSAYGGSDVAHEAFIRVWQQFTDRLIEEGLTGFLMTFAPGIFSDTYDRYPGNDYVDVLSATLYSEYGGAFDAGSFFCYDWYARTGKPVGFSELGCRTGGYAGVGSTPRCSWFESLKSMVTYWPRVSWVNCWGDGHYALSDYYKGNRQNGNDDGALFVHSPYSINLDDLPALYTGVTNHPGVTRLYTKENCSGTFLGLEEKLYTASALKTMGLTLKDVASAYVNQGFGLYFHETADGSGKKYGYMGRVNNLSGVDMTAIKAVEVVHLQNIALDKNILANDNNEFAWRANDGLYSRWTVNTGVGWLMLDLGTPAAIGRYVVRHAGAAGEPAPYNTADFQLQYSEDGSDWITVDTVTANVDPVTDRPVKTFVARYVRLYITKGNSAAAVDADMISIMEFELYGVEGGVVEQTPPGDTSSEPEEDTSSEPADTSSEPADTSSEPADTSSEPEEDTSSEPEDTSSEPADTSSEPEDTSSEPEDTSSEPEDTSSEPEDTSSEPADTSSDPEDTTGEPEDTTDVPEDTFDEPAGELLPEISDEDEENDLSDVSEEEPEEQKKKPVYMYVIEYYFPWWGWVLVGIGVLAVGAILLVNIKKKRRQKTTPEETP